MKTSKRILSLLLAMCLVTGTLVTGVAAISNSTTISDSGGSASALSSEEEESDDVIEIEVSTYEELSAAVTNESYGDKPVLIKMTDDIEITSAIGQSPPTRQWLYATNMVINGQGYTLSASESTKTLDNKMFQGSLNPNSMESVSLTFRNMTIDAKQQYFYSSGSARSANSALILENVTLKNFYSGKISDTSSCSLRFTCNSSYCTGSSLTLNGVPTEDCVGHLMYLEYVPEVNIINSTLETKLAGSTWDVAVYLGVTTDSTLTVEKSTISAHDDESTYMHGIAAYASGSTKTPWTIILDEDSIVSIDARNSDSKALYTNKQGLFILNGCTIRTADDESHAKIGINNSDQVIEVNGEVKGEPEIELLPGAAIQLTGTKKEKLYYSFSDSISDTDPVVVVGTDPDEDGTGGYQLTEDDLEYLVYADESSLRRLKMSEEEGETNTARLYRPNISKCEVELTIPDGWPTAEDVDSETGETVTIIEVTQNDTPAEPIVTLTNLTVDGGGTASALSVGEGANVTVTGGSVLQNGNKRSNAYSGVTNGTILYIADSGTLTLPIPAILPEQSLTTLVFSTSPPVLSMGS